MNIKCPNCGAVHSLDSLINDADASAVLKAVLEMDVELGKAAIRYIGLFRPAKSQLSWARTAKLLNELLPMIKAQEAARDGVCFPAPTEAWIHGFNETVNARDQGRLKLPLKSHGYLLEIISQWQGSGVPSPQPSPTGRRRRTVQAAAGCGSLGRMGRRRLGETRNRFRFYIACRAQSTQPTGSAGYAGSCGNLVSETDGEKRNRLAGV